MRQHRRVAALLVACTLVGSLPAASFAAPSPADIAAAKEHFERGVKLYDETDWQASLVEFKRAYSLSGRWEVLFNIGYAQFQLQSYSDALATFERYLAEGDTKVPADKRERVTREIADLRGRVGTVAISVDVVGAEVFVDEVSVGKAPLASPVRVSTGRRRIVVRAPGRPEVVQSIEVAAGDAAKLEIKVPAAIAGGDANGGRTVTRVSTLTWIGVGVTGAGLIVGSAFGLVALGKKSSLDGECASKHCPSSAQGDIDALNLDATLSTVGFGVAVVGAGLTLAGLFNPTVQTERTAPRASVRPWLGLGSAGIAGSF